MDGCPDTHDHFPDDMPVAMAYVPWQHWKDLYEPRRAFESGTIFMELDKPFLGKGGGRR
nr:spore coat associated protein CotJA [uncultured Mediterraneibacter sp.]